MHQTFMHYITHSEPKESKKEFRGKLIKSVSLLSESLESTASFQVANSSGTESPFDHPAF